MIVYLHPTKNKTEIKLVISRKFKIRYHTITKYIDTYAYGNNMSALSAKFITTNHYSKNTGIMVYFKRSIAVKQL